MIRIKSKDKYILILGLIFIFVWSLPLWLAPGKVGTYDWGFHNHRFEALRRTILEFGQWPGNNPWSMGGQPLLGHPNVSIISVKGLLVLLFGTLLGLKLSVPVYLFIGFWGAWKLSGLWWHNRFVRVIFCLYTAANQALIYHLRVGHVNFQTFYFFPLLLYYLLRFRQDKWSGLKAAILAGLAINDSPAYMSQYALLIMACIFIWLCVNNYKQHFRSLLNWVLLFLPVLAAMSFYRLVTILEIARDFPRILNYQIHYGVKTLLGAYLVPHSDLFIVSAHKWCNCSWEVCSYVGITALFLSIWGLRRGFKWWHAALILLIWAGIGNDSYLHIMYWIQKMPTFSSHLCFSRIRVFSLLFFGVAACWELNYLWDKYKNCKAYIYRYGIIFIAIVMAGEVLTVSHLVMKGTHVDLPYRATLNFTGEFQNTRSLAIADQLEPQVSPSYLAMTMNLGWLGGSGDSYLPGKTVRLAREDPNYIAEFHQGNRAVEPVYWSPNKILFESLDPTKPLVVNMNPGRPWHCNGVQIFSDYRIVEMEKPFSVMPDSNGRIELCYKYPGQRLGLVGTPVLMIVSGFVIICVKKRHDKNNVYAVGGENIV